MRLIMSALFSLHLAHAHEKVGALEQTLGQKYPTIVKFHPPAVHFGIALPFVVLMVELYYLLRGERPGGLSLLINLLTALALLSSVITGYVAHESIESMPIGDEAMEVLHTHQRVGFALVALSLFALLVRIGYSLKEWVALRYVYIFLYMLISIGVVYQGSLGGKLVYEHSVGVPVKEVLP